MTFSSIWSEEAGVDYFVFDSHFKPKKRVQFVPLPFVFQIPILDYEINYG